MSAGLSTAPSPTPTSTLRPRLEKRCLGCGLAEGDVRPLDDEKAPGRVVVWSNPRKLRCDLCDGVANGATKEYHRKYHLGRSRAAQKLVNLHRDEFSLLFAEALKTIEAEERRVDDLVAGGMDRKAAEKLVERERKAAENAEETALAS